MHRKLYAIAIAALAVVCLSGASCTSIKENNPLEIACQAQGGESVDVELCAYTTYGVFVIFEEQAAKLAADLDARARTSPDPKVRDALNKAKNALIAADERAKPIADKMNDALAELLAIRAELEAAGTTDEKILVATLNLQRWVSEASPLIQDLVNAVKGVRS